MKNYPYFDKYLKQGGKCSQCCQEINPVDYCAVNTPGGIKVIHRECLRAIKVNGCYAQIEVLYEV